MACVSIQLLSTEEIDDAYVLARLCDASLTPERWRARVVARNASPATGGVLLARDLEARPCGILVYAMAEQADGRLSLQIETVVGFDVLDPRLVASTLIMEVIRLARAVGCETLCVIRPLGSSVEMASEVLASGVAVLPSLLYASPPGERPSLPYDLSKARRARGPVN